MHDYQPDILLSCIAKNPMNLLLLLSTSKSVQSSRNPFSKTFSQFSYFIYVFFYVEIRATLNFNCNWSNNWSTCWIIYSIVELSSLQISKTSKRRGREGKEIPWILHGIYKAFGCSGEYFGNMLSSFYFYLHLNRYF